MHAAYMMTMIVLFQSPNEETRLTLRSLFPTTQKFHPGSQEPPSKKRKMSLEQRKQLTVCVLYTCIPLNNSSGKYQITTAGGKMNSEDLDFTLLDRALCSPVNSWDLWEFLTLTTLRMIFYLCHLMLVLGYQMHQIRAPLKDQAVMLDGQELRFWLLLGGGAYVKSKRELQDVSFY